MDNDDLGILYGFCLFETFYVDYRGRVFLLEEHVNRILASAEHFGIDATADPRQFKAMIINHIAKYKITDSVLRVTVTAGNKNKGLGSSTIFSVRKNTYTSETKIKGYRICISDVQKSTGSLLLAHKTSNYLENYLLLQEAALKGFDDMLLLNTDGYVTETCKSNIFFVKNEVLCTPGLSCGLLPGIIRKWVIEKAVAKGIPFSEGLFRQDDIFDADEVFVTNSVMGILYVNRIEKTKFPEDSNFLSGDDFYGKKPGNLTEFLAKELISDMESENDSADR